MGKYGWSKEEQDKMLEAKKKRNLVRVFRELKSPTPLMKKAQRLYREKRVTMVSAQGGFLHFEVQSINGKERYDVHRTAGDDWTVLHKYKDNGEYQSVTRVIHQPEKSAYILACMIWLRGDGNEEGKI